MPVPNVRLTDHLGRSHELHRFGDARAIVLFWGGNGCPIVRQSIPRLKQLRDDFSSRNVVFAMINANPQDDRASVAREADEFGIDMPILLDASQVFTRSLGIERTATAVLIDPKTWRAVYRGALDDRFGYGTAKPEPTHHWLRDALDILTAEGDVAVLRTPVKGCLITFEPLPENLSYTEHVAPIVAGKCVTCHRPGDVAPFAFDGYDRLRGWRSMVREVILTKRMPPWHADPQYARFANDISLTAEEERLLVGWLDAGLPRGEGEDSLAMPEPASPEWPLGPPDIEIPIPREMRIPAEGIVEYQYLEVDPGIDEDLWIGAAIILPGNRRVVHHCLVFVKYPEELTDVQPDYKQGLDGYFAGYVPGARYAAYPEGAGKFLPKGSHLVFQLHYTPTGRPETDRTRLGLYVCSQKPERELVTRAAFNTDFEIPPGAPDHEVTAMFRVERNALLWGMSPHMHWRGSRFRYEAHYPGRSPEILLSVPYYDFNWQTQYRFREPVSIPAGTRIVCVGAFDNSARNPANPDPARRVWFGEQTWDEMLIGYMDITYE